MKHFSTTNYTNYTNWLRHSSCLRIVMLLALFTLHCSLFISLVRAQDAFYIYRNDGDFDGFFFDQVIRMGYSKFDLDSVEQDKYVIQEIETKDSLYRIPLAAIDSIGFQQPDIILAEGYKDLNVIDPGHQLHNGNLELGETTYDYVAGGTIKFPTVKIVPDENTYYFYSGSKNSIYGGNLESNSEAKELRSLKEGDVIRTTLRKTVYDENGNLTTVEAPLQVKKVLKVEKKDFEYQSFYFYGSGENEWDYMTYTDRYYIITCEPVDDIGLIFEQYIGVEAIGVDGQGHVRRRVAGLDKMKQRRYVEGNHDIALVNVNQSFTFPLWENADGTAKVEVGADVGLQTRMQAVYNIGLKRGIYTKITISSQFDLGMSLSAKGTITDDIKKEVLPYVRVPFPGVLPVFEVRPCPGAFTRMAAEMGLYIKTPKSGLKASETITIDTKKDFWNMVKAKFDADPIFPQDEGNDWTIEWAISGLIHAGMWLPIKLYTNSWAEKIASISIGSDLFVGPKLSGNLSLNVLANTKKDDVYGTLKGCSLELTPLCVFPKTSATVSLGSQTKEFNLIDGPEMDFGKMTLNLFPDFDDMDVEYKGGAVKSATVRPRGYCTPCGIGIGLLDYKGNFITSTMGGETYSVFYTWDSKKIQPFYYTSSGQASSWPLPIGKWKVCPVISFLGNRIPVPSAAVEVKRTTYSTEDQFLDYTKYTESYYIVFGLLPDAKVSVSHVSTEGHVTGTYEISKVMPLAEAKSLHPDWDDKAWKGKKFSDIPAEYGAMGLSEHVCIITVHHGPTGEGGDNGRALYNIVVEQGGVTINEDKYGWNHFSVL